MTLVLNIQDVRVVAIHGFTRSRTSIPNYWSPSPATILELLWLAQDTHANSTTQAVE